MPHEDIFRRRLSVIILSVASDRKPDLNRLKRKGNMLAGVPKQYREDVGAGAGGFR